VVLLCGGTDDSVIMKETVAFGKVVFFGSPEMTPVDESRLRPSKSAFEASVRE
jgi:hypothetical protein